MVSFQCDGCQDVVKKPKLDNHSYKCQASFTCVDCSKTFNVPVEWKSHTSCVSEAEKYQKGLYKGKKNQTGSSGPRGAKSDAVESASKDRAEKNLPEDKTAEETALQLKGNSDSPVADESTKEDKQGKKFKGEKKKKRKANEIEDTLANEAVPSKETKTTKRQESDAVDDKGKVKADEKTNTDGIPLPETSLSEKEKKKEKKNKKKRDDGADSSQTGGPPEADVRPSSTSATGKKVAEEVRFLGNAASDEAPARKKKEKSKSKKEKSEAVLSFMKESLGPETGEADKKRKRSEAEGGEEPSTHETKKAKKERRREKKRKTEIGERSETAISLRGI